MTLIPLPLSAASVQLLRAVRYKLCWDMLSRSDEILSVIKADLVDLKALKALCLFGCPDFPGIRSKCWKFLLGYLPTSAENREEKLKFHREQYALYVKDFVVESGSSEFSDHPLDSNPDGKWTSFFLDNEVLLQINKDCRRLYPDFDFFHRITDHPISELFGEPVGILRRRVETSSLQARTVQHNLSGFIGSIHPCTYERVHTKTLPSDLSHHQSSSNADCEEQHWEVIERILYVYYKTHVTQGYVQGMNEVIAPIYYLFATDPDRSWRRHAEADTFYCFNNLMAEIHLNFIRKLDNGHLPSIGGQLRLLMDLLAQFDMPLFEHLRKIGLETEHYAFRWFSLLLAREFNLPEVLRLWDTLFSDEHRFSMLPFMCCSMLTLIRDQLLSADFPTAVNLVQHYPSTVPVFSILSKAIELYDKPVTTSLHRSVSSRSHKV